ncbi:MAG: protein-disulfide reductase DsbD [Gammaproteobacteria bacterium]|nr:protein-disulfide reductase DsbD [Gammaproteobacteria bacterium]
MRHALLGIIAALLLPASLALAAPFPFGDASEILRPEQAYQATANATPDRIEVTWRIADGYYLYRDKLGFASASDGVSLGEPELPAPTEIKDDAFFGEMAVYRGDVTITMPYQGTTGDAVLALDLKAQGCADVGICFPPETRRIEVALPAAREEPGSSGGGLNALARLGQKLGFGTQEPEFLDPDEAFVLAAEVSPEGDTLLARWEIADGYYLYRDKFAFSTEAANTRFGEARLPEGKIKDDPYFGAMEIYTGEVLARVPLLRDDPAPGPLTFTATYQGCADGGICYPPIRKEVTVDLPPLADALASPADAAPTTPAAPAVSLSEQDSIAATLASGTGLLTILSFFGFGLLLAFTPCVFPMIPILSGIIVGHGAKVTTKRAFVLSLVYVLAMAVTYTVAGVLAGLFGSNLQVAFQNPWILGSFAGLFVLLSLSMFGLYDLQVPNWAQSRLSHASNRQQPGSLTGVAVMGFLSALIVGPCVAAPLAGALIYIGQTGDAVLGGAALFALSLGMGAPLLLIGTSAGKLLPKAGPWMDAIKAVFGVLLLGVAIWMLERILPAALTMALWAALLIVSAIYLGALDAIPPHGSGWRRLWKGTGLVMLLYGAVLLVGAAGGGHDVFQPLRGVGFMQAGGGQVGAARAERLPSEGLEFKRIKGLADLEREVALASSQGRGVMLDFYADWCVTCKQMERETFSDPGVQARLADTVLLQADVTANDDVDKALLRHFNLIAPPTILFFDRDGKEQRPYRVMGFMDAADFSRQIDAALR